MKVDIKSVSTPKGIKRYIDFAHDLYADDPNYVPELFMAQKEVFDKNKNPFFEHSTVEYYIAEDQQGQVVGRISAILNHNFNEFQNANVAFFGFFDVIEDYSVASALLDKAVAWARDKGAEAILGPTNFSTNDTAGILFEGFHEPPKIMMTYNKPYYQKFLEDYGFGKEMDLYAYMLYTKKASEKSIRLAHALEARLAKQGITIRNLDLKKFESEVAVIREIYNNAWKDNWGFVPWTDAELKALAKEMKMIADPKWVYIAEDNGTPIGFSLTLPDINEITKDFSKGRLFPFNILKLLWRKNKTKYVRILALGVHEDYRKRGIEAIFFAKNILQARASNVLGGEISWVLESNQEMRLAAERLNGELYKKYRLYRLPL